MDNIGFGKAGEEEAVKYLKKAGYKIVERNFRSPLGEIDIVARDGRILVFAEVKTRNSDRYGRPAEAVTPAKQKRYARLAAQYICLKNLSGTPVRFDVIEIYKGEVNHIKDAFWAN